MQRPCGEACLCDVLGWKRGLQWLDSRSRGREGGQSPGHAAVRSGGACLKICSGLPGCFSAPGQQGGGWETAVLLTVCPLPQFCDTDSPVSDPVVFSLMAKLGASSLLISCCLLPLSQLVTIQIPRRQSDWSSTAFEVKMSFMVCLLIGCPCQVSSNQLWLPLNRGPGWDNFPT